MADTEIAGCPVKPGEMLFLPIAAANRDPREFADADKVLIGRTGKHHLAFGAGPHRCLGSHLARLELNVAMTEWHVRIPAYRIDPSVPIVEHGGQIGLDNLPLRWDAPADASARDIAARRESRRGAEGPVAGPRAARSGAPRRMAELEAVLGRPLRHWQIAN